MAIRAGIDLVSVTTVAESVTEHGERYLNRVYTEAELNDCQGPDGPVAERLAARFAAKEAALKVLRPADEAIPWREIEVVRDPSGSVTLALAGRALGAAERQGLKDFAVSISHEGDYATAVVVAAQA
ncbi:MAG TPA: holo-ACP synthase [Solirubrobacteraceae bacterium]|nr:holo-ACP synthase [Solirubrobacteraceae bacterium]